MAPSRISESPVAWWHATARSLFERSRRTPVGGARSGALRLRRSLWWGLIVLAQTGCGRLEEIPFSPVQTPESWLRIQPFAELHIASRSILIVQPTTSAIVYLLGLVTIGVGLTFLRIRNGQRSRLWWGIALLLWGTGALLAGTSYEAFSYQIKCAGRELCVWTSWWEVSYLIVSAASVDAMLLAQAHACNSGRMRTLVSFYAWANLALYIALVLAGAFLAVRFLLSFELLLIVAAPSILFLILQNSRRYRKQKRPMDLVLLGAWLWLVVTMAAYFIYLISGLTQRLWDERVWFSENDVLHLGLIVWMAYLGKIVAPQLVDEPSVVPQPTEQ